MPGPKETAYDEHINPLMARVIDLCREHGINMAAQFALDHDETAGVLYCTTVFTPDLTDTKGAERMAKLSHVMQGPHPQMLAITITKAKPAGSA